MKFSNCNFMKHQLCQELQDLFVSLIYGDTIDRRVDDSEIYFFFVLMENFL